jgi:hypothetical protein
MREVLKDVNTPSAAKHQPPRAKSTPASVTAHRLFPAIVALWFAALLGIGSLAIAPEALSAVVSALGIPKLIHAAAPPLGFTARVLLALVMAGLGVVIGLVIGNRIAASQRVQSQRKTDPTRGRQEKPVRKYSYNPAEYDLALQAPSKDELAAEPEAARQRRPLRASEAFADIEPLTETSGIAQQVPPQDPALLSDDHFAVLGAPKAKLFEPEDELVRDNFDALLAKPVAPELPMEPEQIVEFAPPAPFTTLAEPNEPPAFEEARQGRFSRKLAELQATEPEFEPGLEPAVLLTKPTAPASAAPMLAAIGTIEAALQRLPADADVRRQLGEAQLENLGTVQLVERLALAMAAAAQARDNPTPLPVPIEQTVAASAEAVEPTVALHEALNMGAFVKDTPEQEFTPPFAAPIAEQVAVPVDVANEPRSAPNFSEHAAEHARVDAPHAAPEPWAPCGSILDPIAQAWDEESIDDEDASTIAPPRFLSARAVASEEPKAQPAHAHQAPTSTPLFGGRQSHPAATIDEASGDSSDDPPPAEAGEDRYPSLLDIQPTTREPIRIAAPEAQQAEPTVMFTNAVPRADTPFAPPPASTLQSRRSLQIQPPAGAMAGVPVTPPELLRDPVDAEDADRALRAALATLQRMSSGR